MKKLYTEYYKDIENLAALVELEEQNGLKNIRRKLAIKYLEKIKDKKILDVGCGLGFDASYFFKKGFDIYACDISNKAIKYAKKANPGPKYFIWDFEKRPYKEKFDAIYSFEVIEHVLDYDSFLKNLYDTLNKCGIILITTPNVIAPRDRINLLFGRDEWFASKYHIHYFSPRTLKIALENAGFKNIELKSSGLISFLGSNFGGSLFVVGIKI